MRTIIRFSLNKDKGSALGQELRAILEGRGFVKSTSRTATYEGTPSNHDVRYALRDFWKAVDVHTGPATIDHFWMYRDNRVWPVSN